MNRIFRLVWDQLKKCWVVTSELARGRGKTRRGAGDPRRKPWWALVPLAAPLLAMAAGPAAAAERVQPPVRPAADAAFPVARVAPPVRPAATAGVAPGAASGPSVADPAGSLPAADALPGNGQVTAGSGTIRQDGLTTTIEQDSRTLSLTWDSFDIGADGTVRFLQPDALSIAVNRILGSDASMIFGRLEANGQVFLINPNGVLFGEGAQVNVGGLVASTLDVDDASLGSDRLTFNGDSTAGIVNKGTITASNGGYIALLGHQVSNQGTITAQLGSVALAGGNTVTLDFDGQRLLGIQVDRNLVDALAENHQLVVADGGQVLMSAGAKDSLLASVVNNTGVVQAGTVANRDGRIVLLGGMQAGTTHVAGTLDASAPTTGDGGFIETSAANVRVADGATVTTLAADGATGTWLVDPTDFTVSAGGAAQTASGIGADTLSSNLETSNITLTTAAPGSDPGNIHVDAAVGWNANTTLALVADNRILLNAPVTAPNGGLELDAARRIVATAPVEVGTFTLVGGNWRQLGAVLPAFEADDFRLQGGTFLRALGGNGSAANPYQLTDVYGLQGVDSISLLGSHFALANDIDASGTANWNGGLGFDPIGDDLYWFDGVLDGLGHVISGLTIDRPTQDHVGLFSFIAGGELRNVGLAGGAIAGADYVGGLVGGQVGGTITQSYATGAVSGGSRVGGLVGRSSGAINQSYATGTVHGDDYGVGGLVGLQVFGTTNQSYATGAVSGVESIGGLVGENLGGTISQSYATGAVSGEFEVGGLVGSHDGTISQSYATGAVHGDEDHVGGLVGFNHGTISQSYATGTVSGTSWVGGLVGRNFNPAATTDSYWDTETTGQATSAGGTGLTTAELIEALPAGFDAGVWSNAGNQTTPFLVGLAGNRVFNINDLPAGTITATNRPSLYTVIQDVDQLQAIENRLGGRYVLGNDIDASGTASWNGGLGFNPIGNGLNPFVGVFDGLGHVISGLTIDRPMQDYVGLFGSTDGSELRNVGLEDGSVRGDRYVGGLVGNQREGTISQSYATGAVSGRLVVGGLVGFNTLGTINQSYATAEINGSDSIGGLVGFNRRGTIDQSYATGAVYADSKIGGLVGYDLDGTIRDSYATGAVEGRFNVGGLIGYHEDGTISRSYATGEVDGYNFIGGLVGNMLNATIDQSYATGTVNGERGVGGLVGQSSFGTISQSYATGTVNGGVVVGGLVGSAWRGTISQSYATGTVNGEGGVGGLVGSNEGTISQSYATGAVSGDISIGGLIGYSNSGAISQSYATGAVSGVITIGGLVGGVSGGSISQSYATGAVDGDNEVGGLVGDRTGPATTTIIDSYWDTETTGQSTSDGGTALTTAEMMDAASFVGWDLATEGGSSATWRIYEGHTAPLLRAYMTDLVVASNDVTTTYDGNDFAGSSDFTFGAVTPGFWHPGSTVDTTLIEGAADTSGEARDAGTYALDAGPWSSQRGYDIAYTAGTLTIDPKAITVDATADDKVYDGTTDATATLASGGVIAGDDIAFDGTATFDDKNAGTGKTVTVDGIAASGADAGNYSFNTTATDTADISQLAITVDATAADKVYDGTTDATASLASGGVIAGDDIAFDGTATFDDKNAGTGKTVTVDGIAASGTDAGNYSFNTTATDTASISQLAVTVDATADDKVYDGTTDATASLASGGVIAGDDIAFDGTATFADKNAGTGKTVTVDGIAASGTDAGNYSFNTSATDTADISQLAITVDATADDKVYDGTTAATATLASNGVITGDDIGFDGTAMFGDKNVGTGKTVTVEGIAASGTDAGNYSFNTTATDTADITPATLVYVAAPDTIFAGQQPTGFEGQVTGLVAGETLEEATDGTLAWTTPATVDSAPGAYAIEGSGLGAANYVFEQAPGNATALTVIHGRAPFAATSLVAALQDLEGSQDEAPLHAPDITIVAGGVRLP